MRKIKITPASYPKACSSHANALRIGPIVEASAVQPDFDYELLERQTASLFENERHFLANTSNFAALIFSEVPQVNWAGFYFSEGEELVLGPFSGKPACTRLPATRGVCAAALHGKKTIVVDDVRDYDGHIVCDSASRSEIALPLTIEGAVIGVFDIDSPAVARFTPQDCRGLERVVARFVAATAIPRRYRQTVGEHNARQNERIDIQTCRDHHVVIRYLVSELDRAVDSAAARGLLRRLKTVLVAHLKLEDNWLYPRLTASSNQVVRHKAQQYEREMGGLKGHFESLLQSWSADGAIESQPLVWGGEWRIFSSALSARMTTEDEDLYVAAEADLGG